MPNPLTGQEVGEGGSFDFLTSSLREAAKKVLFSVARPLRRGGGKAGRAGVAGPLRKKLFCVFSYLF